MSAPYMTADEIAQRLGYPTSDTAAMTEFAALLPDVQSLIETYCNVSFAPRAALTRRFDGTGTNILSLGGFLRSMTSVRTLDGFDVPGVSLGGGSDEDGDGHPLYTWLDAGEGAFPEGFANIQIAGDWGMSSLPAGVKAAMGWTMKHLLDLRIYDATKALETGFGRTAAFVKPDEIHYIPPHAQRALSTWRQRTL